MLRLRVALPLLLVVGAGGCNRQPEFAPVEGTVTLAGKPAARIEVAFYADGETQGPVATGMTDDRGHFRLQTETGQVGAVVGQHKVCLYDRSLPLFLPGNIVQQPPSGAVAKQPSVETKSAKQKPVSRVPEAYCRPWETPLKVEVRAGSQAIDFRLP